MVKFIGQLGPDSTLDMFPHLGELSELDRAKATAIAAERMADVIADAHANGVGQAQGHFIVELDDGRIVATPYFVQLGNQQEE